MFKTNYIHLYTNYFILEIKREGIYIFICVDPLFIAIKMLRIQNQLYQNLF